VRILGHPLPPRHVARRHRQLPARLAAETVSRVRSRFRIQKLIRIEERELQALDRKGLRAIRQALLPD
jgi:hypothetical protein